jgi:multiple sugar transport system permease protein
MRLANEAAVLTRPRTRIGVSAGRRQRVHKVLTWVLLLAGAVLMLMPLIWMLSSSLKLETRVFEYPPRLIPRPARFQNYVDALTYKPFHLYLRNTLFLVVMNEIAVLVTSSFCAYGFARVNFKGRNFWFSVLMAVMMLPNIVLMVPQFVIFSRLKWIDTFLPLVVPPFFGGGAFNIFLLRQFFRSIPEDLADAARIDGCNEFMIYARVMLPLAKPALTTVAIFTFISTWNNFMGPLLYFNSSENYTVSIGLAMFRSVMRTRWDLLMAASAAMTLPMIAVFFAAQRYFVQGVVLTGLKG